MSQLTRAFAVTNNNNDCDIYWKELEPIQLKLMLSVMKGHKTRSSIKEMIVDELKYANEKNDEVGMFKHEWIYVIDRLSEKLENKRSRNRDEMQYLINILNRFVKGYMR